MDEKDQRIAQLERVLSDSTTHSSLQYKEITALKEEVASLKQQMEEQRGHANFFHDKFDKAASSINDLNERLQETKKDCRGKYHLTEADYDLIADELLIARRVIDSSREMLTNLGAYFSGIGATLHEYDQAPKIELPEIC